MDTVFDERLEHRARTQPGTLLDQHLQLIEVIDDHIPEPIEGMVAVMPYNVECEDVLQRRHMPRSHFSFSSRGRHHDP
jgi:hypothetical protein